MRGQIKPIVSSIAKLPNMDVKSAAVSVPQERLAEFNNRFGGIAIQANDAQVVIYQLRSLPLPSNKGVKRYALASIIENKGMAVRRKQRLLKSNGSVPVPCGRRLI